MIFRSTFSSTSHPSLIPNVCCTAFGFGSLCGFRFVQTRHHEWIYGPNYGLVDFSLSREADARPKVTREYCIPHSSPLRCFYVYLDLCTPAFSPVVQTVCRRRLGT